MCTRREIANRARGGDSRHFKAVVRTDALRKPVRGVPERVVGERSARWIVVKPSGIVCGASAAGQMVVAGRFASTEATRDRRASPHS